jgi:hypothetical protein
MRVFQRIAEERIRQALEEGAFEGLPGEGRPLVLDDDRWVPEDLRLGYRVLRNAGCLPAELELRKEILSLRALISTLDDDEERFRKIREMNSKLLRLATMREGAPLLDAFPEYEDHIIRKFSG